MSDYGSAAERARRIGASVARLEARSADRPEDRALRFNLAAKNKLLRRAREQLEGIAQDQSVELCDYRLIPREDGRLLLPHISRSLLNYQYIFSQTYDSLRNGPRQNARIGDEAWSESVLQIGYTYSGSFGTILLAPAKRDFFEGNFDRTVEAVYQLLDISDGDDVRDVAKTLGEAVIKRLHDWSAANVEGGFDVDVSWRRSDGRQFGRVVNLPEMERIVALIGATSDEMRTEIEAVGVLVGIDVKARNFHFVVPDGDEYRGALSEGFITDDVVNVPAQYASSIVLITTVHYASGRETRRYELERLDKVVS